jgi:hypothetical protein
VHREVAEHSAMRRFESSPSQRFVSNGSYLSIRESLESQPLSGLVTGINKTAATVGRRDCHRSAGSG